MTGKRKHTPGNVKLKIREKRNKLTQSMAGSMDKFVLRKDDSGNNEHINTNVNDGENLNEFVSEVSIEELVNEDVIIEESLNEQVDDEQNLNENVIKDLYDPGNWKKNMSQNECDMLIEKGPIRVLGVNYPLNGKNPPRSFNESHYILSVGNLEKYDRSWLVYSQCVDKVFYFVVCYLIKACQVI